MVSVDYIFKVAQYGDKSVPLTATVNLPKQGSRIKGIAIYFHGGGYVVGSRAMLGAAHIETLTELGLVTVTSDYRLSPTISVLEGAVGDSIAAYEWAQNELPQLLKKEHGLTVDGKNIVTLGHSCGGGIALLMAARPNPPKAILDLFGFKYLRDPFFHTPHGPPGAGPPQEFADKVFEEYPPPVAAPPPFGPNGPDLSKPRSAFLIGSVQKGTLFDKIIAEDEYDQVDPAGLFKKPGFPSTYFIQGTEDKTLDVEITESAYAELKGNGVETELCLVQGAPHGFDARLKRDDAAFGVIETGLKFLAAHL